MDPILRRTLVWYLLHLMTYSVTMGRFLLTELWPAFEVLPLFVTVWLTSSVLFSEREESYAFLRTLPVTDRAIVRTKFRLMLAMGAVYWLAMEGVALARGTTAWSVLRRTCTSRLSPWQRCSSPLPAR